ncbi:MAG: DNA primase [Nitrospinae bacterium RIFCSPLOWO2_12_FULL_47_7]|nr:MAG: DNA primase [Nitrospinae bacterium RIFCSPLOWO2_12_FULL_47_7]
MPLTGFLTALKHIIPENIIEEIRTRANIVEVVLDAVLIKKSGKDYKGLCPFHSEKTPSFTVSPEKQIYHCFGCNAGGNVFKFLMETQSLSFVEAVKKLALRYGVVIPETRSGENNEVQSERETLIRLNVLATEYFSSLLQNPSTGKAARDYISSRHLNNETVGQFQLGWASSGWRDLLNFLQKKSSYPIELIEKAGLVKRKENSEDAETCYDRFRGRLIFPFKDIHGNTIGFAGRLISGEEGPKYLNSPETLLYKKGNHLFGLNTAREAIRKEDRVLLVEGYFDQIRAYQHGIKNVVATCGTALTPNQVSLLKNHTTNVTLVFDADAAGQAAVDRGYDLLLRQGMSVKVLSLPNGHDPDSYIHGCGAEPFLRQAKEAVPFLEYFIEKTIRNGDITTGTGRLNAVNIILPLLGSLSSSVERSEVVRHLSERVGVEDKALLSELRKNLHQKRSSMQVSASQPIKEIRHNPESYLIQLMLLDESLAQSIRMQVTLEEYANPLFRQVAEIFYKRMEQGQAVKIDQILDYTNNMEIKSFLTQAGLLPILFDNPEKAAADCVAEIKKAHVESNIKELKKQRLEAQKTGQAQRSRDLHNLVRKMESSINLGKAH